MLNKAQKKEALQIVSQSDLSASKKRSLVSHITSKGASLSSVNQSLKTAGVGLIGAIGAIGGGLVLGGKFLEDKFMNVPSKDPDWYTDGDDRVDNSSGNPGNRVPVDGADRSNDGAVRDPDNHPDQIYDRDGNPIYDDEGNLISDGTNDRTDSLPDGDQTFGDYSGSGFLGGLGLSDLISALANRFLDFELTGGEREANEFTAEQNRLANEFSAHQAEISRDWQEQMYEKYNSMSGKIAQAEAAGVNPMFAVGNGVTPTGFSSSSPSGSSGSSVGASPALGGNLAGLIQSFLGIAKVKSDIAKTQAETAQISVNTDIQLQKLPAEIAKLESSTGLDRSSSDLNFQKIVESATSVEKIKSDMNLNDYHAKMFASQVAYLEVQADYINSIKDSEKKIKAAQALVAEWQEKNKELFKGLEVGTDVVNTLSNIGLGIFNAKTGRILSNRPSSGGLVINNSIPLPFE